MSDLIDRQAVIEALWKPQIKPDAEIFHALRAAQQSLVEQLPSVQPKRKTGKWIDAQIEGLNVQVCNQCKTFYPLAYMAVGHSYCPHCGAKMEVEQDD